MSSARGRSVRVINRLPPLPDESLESLLARLRAANRYPKNSWYLPLPGPSAPRDPNRLRDPAHLQAVGELVGLDTCEVRELTLGRFEPSFTNAAQPPSGEVREGTAEVADGMRSTRFRWYAQGQGRGRVCRECLRESEALMLPWSLRLVTACPVHHADFAWPEQHKAIEAWGGIHTARYPTGEDVISEQNARQVERAQRAGYELMILRDEDLTSQRWDETRERVRRFLEID